AGTERAAGHDGELGHIGTGHRHHELGAVAGYPGGLVLLTDHESGDVLKEDERHATLARELDEVRALLGGLCKQHAVVREDPDRVTLDTGEPADERLAVEGLELVKPGAVHEAGNQ